MLDLHKRIHGGVDKFFVPDDNEISLEELEYILHRAKNWKGAGGSRRRVHVNTFKITDPVFTDFSKECVHIAIFTTMVDGTRDLFRHFLRQENGSIIEISEESMQHFSGRLALEKLLGCSINDNGTVELGKGATDGDVCCRCSTVSGTCTQQRPLREHFPVAAATNLARGEEQWKGQGRRPVRHRPYR